MLRIKKELVYLISVSIAVLIIGAGLVLKDNLVTVADSIMEWVSLHFGWLYIGFVFFLCVFLSFLAFSKYGNIKLGKDYEKPEYSNFSWYAMLFCGGTGIGLVFWSIAEPLSHYASPPEGIIPGTLDSASFSLRTSFLHWGITQWVCFALVALGLAFIQFRKGEKALISNLISPIIGKKLSAGWLGKIIDVFAVVVSFAGVATSLGLGVSQICGGLNYLFDVPNNKMSWLIIIIIVTCIFLFSAISGVNRGIKILSNINTYIAFALLILVFAIGPKTSAFSNLINGVGQHLQNFIGDVLMINPYVDSNWIMNWRVFYYAWFIAWTPFVGMFIAQISKGRTIREFLIGVVIVPTLFTVLWLSVFGTIALQTCGDWSIEAINQLVAAPETAVFVVFSHYPLSKIISILIVILLSIFFITSADSATYALSMMTSDGNSKTPIYKKITWAVIIATIAYILLSVGNIKALQTISIAASLPFLFIMIAMCPALIKDLRKEKNKFRSESFTAIIKNTTEKG